MAKSSLKVSPESTSSEPEPRPAMSRKGKKSEVPSMLPRTRTVRGVSEAVVEGNRDETVEDVDKVCRTGVVAIAKDNSRFDPGLRKQLTASVHSF